MKLVIPSEFAKIAKVSRQAIGKALKPGGALRYSVGTKQIDIEDPLAQKYLTDRILLPKRGVKQGAPTHPAGKTSSSRKQNESPNSDDSVVIDSMAVRKAIAVTLKAEGDARKVDIETEKARGKLIKRDLVSHILSKLYIIDSNELRPLNDKMAPMICSELEIDDPEKIQAVNKIIEKEIFRTLAHIQRLLDEFLVLIEAEPLPDQPELEAVK